ncbi:MAG: SDR family NAD(P)-dependent oxidoreductase [Chloroflexota bacterium]
MPPNWQGKIALVTGASSGIGAATARALARQGLRVVLVARRLARLQGVCDEIQAAGGQAQALAADLSAPDERQGLYEQLHASSREPDVLVNNAGLGWYGYYNDMPWETAQEMLSVNVAAVAHLTRLFLPGMRQRRRGHIINVGSISGSLPNQGIAIYSASKSFLDSFTTALYRELVGSQVYVSVVRAGPVISEFYQNARLRPGGRPIPAERFAVPAERVAAAVQRLLRRPRRVVYVPGLLIFSPWLETLFGWLVDRLGPLLLRRPQSPGE